MFLTIGENQFNIELNELLPQSIPVVRDIVFLDSDGIRCTKKLTLNGQIAENIELKFFNINGIEIPNPIIAVDSKGGFVRFDGYSKSDNIVFVTENSSDFVPITSRVFEVAIDEENYQVLSGLIKASKKEKLRLVSNFVPENGLKKYKCELKMQKKRILFCTYDEEVSI